MRQSNDSTPASTDAALFSATRVLIKGAGDLASGVALRLHRCGFPVIMSELAHPLAVRRTVAFAQAVFDGECMVEEVHAWRCTVNEVDGLLAAGKIPLLVEPQQAEIACLQSAVLVDAIMAKYNTGTEISHAPLVVALGPGFAAGVDCHAVIETNRGHMLGRVLWCGQAEANTGEPGELPGVGKRLSRVLRAPLDGWVESRRVIGDRVCEGETIAIVRSSETGQPGETQIVAPFSGMLRGLIHPAVLVTAGLKIGDLDPRADPSYCFTVSDKSLAIGGGVLEAILSWFTRRSPSPANNNP